MSVAVLPISFDENKVADFCMLHGIRRLSLFGSVLREDFDPSRSDIDVYAEFEPGALRGLGLDYFGFAGELEKILGRWVDFCTKLNKYILPKVMQEMLPIYERA